MDHADPTVSDVTDDPWDLFLRDKRRDIGFMQSSWWSGFLADRHWDNFGVFFRGDGEIIGGARVLVRYYAPGLCYYYVADGPVLPADETDAKSVFQGMLAFIDNKRAQQAELVSHLRLEPRWQERPTFVKGFREAGSWLEPRDTLLIDLAPPASGILAQMKPKGRYNIGVARRHGIRVVEDASENGEDDFLEIYGETMSRHGLGGKREDYLRDLIDILVEKDCGTLLFAELGGQRLAAMLLVFFGDRATYFFGGSLPIRRQAMAPYLLHFEAMLKAKSLGYRWYDFYGVAPPGKSNHRWAQISTFKRKFGGQTLSFVPSLDLIYDTAGYEAYRSRKSAKRSQTASTA